jgi:hypothetical protein
MRAVRTALRGGLAGRRLQALVIGVVMLATAAASTLAAGLVADSNAPFDHAFAAQHGADIAVIINPQKVSAGELAATARLADVTAAAGPFAEATVARARRRSRLSGAHRRAVRWTTSCCRRGTGRQPPGRSLSPAVNPERDLARSCALAR